MTIEETESVATILGVAVAAVALVAGAYQLWQQKLLSRQERMIQIYLDCTGTFARLFEERMDLLEAHDQSKDVRRRLNRLFTSYWDLMAAEYEFALSGMLPHEVFLRWFEMMHDELHQEGPGVAGLSLAQSWDAFGVRFAGRISPGFSRLMEFALAERDVVKVTPFVQQALKTNRGEGLFRRFQ